MLRNRNDLYFLFAFSLALSLNPKKTIEQLCPVKREQRASWDSYCDSLLRRGIDTQLRHDQYSMAHHLMKKYVMECGASNAWRFCVKLDSSGLAVAILIGAQNVPETSSFIFHPSPMLDKLVLLYLNLHDVLMLASLSVEMRFRVWMFLWLNPGVINHL